MITADLETAGDVGTWLFGDLLSGSETKKKIISSQKYLFVRKGLWNRDQLVLILAGPNRKSLLKNIQNDTDRLFALVNHDVKMCWRNALYEDPEERKTSKYLLKNYGWTFRKQASFRIEREIPNVSFYDSLRNRTYMIDFAAYDPGKPKLSLMREMEAVVHTFDTGSDS